MSSQAANGNRAVKEDNRYMHQRDVELVYHCTFKDAAGTPCERHSTRSSDIVRHYKGVHLGQKPFKCTMCTEAFAQKSALVTHMKSALAGHNNIRDLPCRACDRHFADASARSRHERMVHKLPAHRSRARRANAGGDVAAAAALALQGPTHPLDAAIPSSSSAAFVPASNGIMEDPILVGNSPPALEASFSSLDADFSSLFSTPFNAGPFVGMGDMVHVQDYNQQLDNPAAAQMAAAPLDLANMSMDEFLSWSQYRPAVEMGSYPDPQQQCPPPAQAPSSYTFDHFFGYE